jgi:hypothetical protein
VYTLKDFACIEVNYDEDFVFQQIIPKAKLYVLKVVLPEILTRYWTKQNCEKTVSQQNNISANNDLAIPSCSIPSNPTNESPSHDPSTLSQMIQSHTCFCNGTVVIPETNNSIIRCASNLCRAKVFHRFCLESLGKKRFNKNWICNACKADKKKSEKENQLNKRQKTDNHPT